MNYLYLVKRTAIAFLSIVVVASVVFGVTTLLPGSAANIVLGTEATEQTIQQVNKDLGLNRPLHVQYVDFVGGVFTGDFGESLISGQPVSELIWPRLLRTLQLATVAMLISIVTAIPLGSIAAATTW